MKFTLKHIYILCVAAILVFVNSEVYGSDSKYSRLTVDSLNQISFDNRRIDFDLSYKYAEKALAISDSLDYAEGKAYAYKNMGTAQWSRGYIAKAKDFYYKSLVIYEGLKDSNGIGRLWNNIGLIDITQDDFESAIENFEKSLVYTAAVKDTVMLGTSYLNIGVAYYYLEDYKNAILKYNKSIEYATKAKDSITLANNYAFLGVCNTRLKEYKEAVGYLYKSLKIYKNLNLVRDIAHNYNLLADYYIATKNYKKSIRYAKLAYETSDSITSKANLLEACRNLSLSYSNLGDYKKAFEFQVEATSIYTELTREESRQKLAALTLEYEYDKKIQQIESNQKIEHEKQEANIHSRNMVILIISIVGIFLIIFAIFLYRSNLLKKHKNLQLLAQKDSIDEKNKQLKQMNHKLNELNDTKDKFFSIIAHDLKNPIYSLNSMAQIVSTEYDTIDDHEKKDLIGHISRASAYVYSLLENLLTWSRSQRNQINYSPIEGQPDVILQTTLEGISLVASEKKIDFNYEMEKATVFSDINLLNTVVRNILSNAVKFTPPDGKVNVIGEKRMGAIE